MACERVNPNSIKEEGGEKKMVSWADGESKQEAEVELYQMEINILNLAGHQYCKTLLSQRV